MNKNWLIQHITNHWTRWKTTCRETHFQERWKRGRRWSRPDASFVFRRAPGTPKGPLPECSRRSRCQKVSQCFKSNPYNLKINCCHELVDSPVNSHIGAAGFSRSDIHISVGLHHRTDFFKQCPSNIWVDFCPKRLFASSPFFSDQTKMPYKESEDNHAASIHRSAAAFCTYQKHNVELKLSPCDDKPVLTLKNTLQWTP